MAISEAPLIDAELMAIAEINQTGGVLGQLIDPVIEDGASNPAEFERKARKLIQGDRVATVFGCWTSASRKAVKPVVEELNALLWYPLQYEGLECSKNIFYTGSCPNQQVEPAVTWLLQNKGTRFYLLGSDYVFPRTAHKLIKAQLKQCRSEGEEGLVVGEEYVPIGAEDFTEAIARIEQAKPDVVFNTLNGDSNLVFYRQYKNAGITANQLPIMAVSIAEAELQRMGDAASGHYASWTYFQSLDTPNNRKFVQNFQCRYGSDRVTSDPIEAAYTQVYLWKQAVEQAQSFEVEQVRVAAYERTFEAPGGLVRIEPNHHIWKDCKIGQILPTGQFKIVYSSENLIKPLPWLGVEEANISRAAVVMDMLAEIPQEIQYSWQLEQKSHELEATTTQLHREIAERQRAEEVLRKSEVKYRDLVETANCIIMRWDTQGRITFLNDYGQRFFGYDQKQILGCNITGTIVPETETSGRDLRSLMEDICKNPDRYVLNENENIRSNGERVWVCWTNKPILDEEGQLIEILSVGSDATERKRSEAALQQAKEAAEVANRSKSEFLSKMSHELRTPLNAILGFTQVLTRDTSLNQEQLEQLEIINRSGEHLLTLINDVLEMSKIEAGRISLNETSFDLYRLLDSLEEMLQLKAESKGLQLVFDCAPDVPQYVQADEGKLRQILINLLGNAIKFTQEGGVTLRVRMAKGELGRENWEENHLTPNSLLPSPYSLFFEVEDTGFGIAPQELDTLFEPFVQSESGRKSQEGTGLGLPISQQFVRLMGGDITVSSILGQGTVFRFDVPIRLAEAADVQMRQAKQRVIGLEPGQPMYRILIVEDRWENRQLLVKLLSPLGFEVREAANGQEGVALWKSWEPHLIWMDMRMPVMDGYEATKQIKAQLKGQATVIIALTASALEEERSIVLSAGCDDFVRKPFQASALFEKIAQYLGVRYIYEEPTTPSSLQPGALPGVLTTEALAVMPDEWVAQLHQAATQAHAKLIFQLIEQIPEQNAPLASALRDFVNNFRFDKIIDLTQKLQHEK
jgi:urea ABC transporter urea binding protein